MPWFLGSDFKLHSYHANIVRKASAGTYMHRDQMRLTPDTQDKAYLLNAMWYLVDVPEERGATRVYPGSHNKNVVPVCLTDVVGVLLPVCFFFGGGGNPLLRQLTSGLYCTVLC